MGGLQVRQELLGGLQVGLQASHASSQALPGSHPLKNSDLGLVLEAQWVGRDAKLSAHAAAAEVFFGTATNEVVTKGNTQKADNAPVPDRLWLHAFVLGYGDGLALAHHSTALGVELGGHILNDPPAGKDPHAGWLLQNQPPPGWNIVSDRVQGVWAEILAPPGDPWVPPMAMANRQRVSAATSGRGTGGLPHGVAEGG